MKIAEIAKSSAPLAMPSSLLRRQPVDQNVTKLRQTNAGEIERAHGVAPNSDRRILSMDTA
jgi:hypothetical protein